MCRLDSAEKNSKFEALESLITYNGVIGLIEKKEKEREGRRRKFQAGRAWRT
jgi:hypothetical protein